MASSELKKNLPDCLVIDIAMPNNWGFQFIQEIKKIKNFNTSPLFYLLLKVLQKIVLADIS